jgi:curved DNA-binding protein CbpA
MTSLYETLEVSPHASTSVIRAAYRCLAQQDHPDKNPGTQDAGQRMASLNRAYAVLSNLEKRQAYDLSLGIAPQFSERRGIASVSPRPRKSGANPIDSARLFSFRPLE